MSGNLFNKFEENFTVDERNAIRKKYLFQKPIVFEFPSESLSSYCNGGGREHINIMPPGDATFCPPVPFSYGNIKKESLKVLLAKIEADYKRLKHCTCQQCPVNYVEYREKCNARFIYPKEE